MISFMACGEAFISIQHKKWNSIQAFMVKNSDRARLEKCFEDLMDNDWRVFRARLVAQEQTEALDSSPKHSCSRVHESSLDSRDEKQSRQDKFGNIFAAIFSGNNKRENEDKPTTSSIFDGDSIGGATPLSRLPSSCEDPFVSEAEIPLLMPTKVTINKHRWSHPMSHIEPGCILVANEKLGGVFYHTIVLITEHSDKKGTTGFVINK
jgi:putative transcriptional regulator